MPQRIVTGALAILFVAGLLALPASKGHEKDRDRLFTGRSSVIEDAWASDPESMLRQARARLGMGDRPLPPLSPLAPHPVVPDGQLGEFRHGTWPSLGVGDGNWTHAGVDLTAPCGSRVLAFADGTVVDRIAGRGEPDFDALGHLVLIEHPERLLGRRLHTLYLHLQDPPRVAVGDIVEGGRTVIGRVGATGAALGCHLHFEARFFAGRFHPDWGNIYGRGDRRSGEELNRDWLDPLLLFRAFPEGLQDAAAMAEAPVAAPQASAPVAAGEQSGPVLGVDGPAADLLLALEELDRALHAKIESDLDMIAFAYWAAFDIQRARRWADLIMAPVEIIKSALDIHLLTEGIAGIQTRIKRARSALELAALVTGFVQADAALRRLQLTGPDLGEALETMITSASAHPRNMEAFQATIRRHLEGEGAAVSPIALIAPGGPDAVYGPRMIRGVGEVRRALAAELSRLTADLASSPPEPAMTQQVTRSVRELAKAVKDSRSHRQEVSLPVPTDATAHDALNLGAITEVNRAWTHALGNYDHDMAIEQVVAVTSLTKLGVSYLTLRLDTVDATGAAIHLVQTFATALELGTFATELAFTTGARQQVNALPHQMVLALAPELANLWRLVHAVETMTRGQFEAARPTEPPLVAATPEGMQAPALGEAFDIVMHDGSAFSGRIGAQTVGFVTAFGTLPLGTDLIIVFGEGELHLSDGSTLRGDFAQGSLRVATAAGEIDLALTQLGSLARQGHVEAAEAQPETIRPATGEAYGTLVGRVLDNFGRPLAAATVRLQHAALVTETAADGSYELSFVPGKLQLIVSKPGYDEQRLTLEIAQAARLPLEDVMLVKAPPGRRLFVWGERDWLPVASCQIEQVERDDMNLLRSGRRRYVARGQPSRVVTNGMLRLLDATGAKATSLLRVQADGTISTYVRSSGWQGYRELTLGHPPEEDAVPLRTRVIGAGRTIVEVSPQPGIYAYVARPAVLVGLPPPGEPCHILDVSLQ